MPVTLTNKMTRAVIVTLLGLTTVSLAGLAQAGPISGGYGQWPFVKLGVYQGLAVIAPGVGSSIMELGNAGRDIASSGDIFIRPGGLVDSLQVYNNSGRGSLAINNGQLCLAVTPGKICNAGSNAGNVCTLDSQCPPGPPTAACIVNPNPDCQSSWPSEVGGTDPYWSLNGNIIQPTVANTGVRVGTDFNTPMPGSTGTDFGLAVYANYSTTPAIKFSGGGTTCVGVVSAWCPLVALGNAPGKMRVEGKLEVRNSTLATLYYPSGYLINPWDKGNDGLTGRGMYGQGPDADTFDSTSVVPFPPAGGKIDLFWKKRVSNQETTSYQCVSGARIGAVCNPLDGGNPCPGLCQPVFKNSRDIYEAICVHTDAKNLCASGQYQGQPCTSDANCDNIPGACTALCGTNQSICLPDPYPSKDHGHCDDNGADCTSALNCNADDTCIWGQEAFYGFRGTGYCTASKCAATCQSTRKIRCSGEIGSCGPYGSTPYHDTGDCTLINSANPPGKCYYNMDLDVSSCPCDCLLTKNTPYLTAASNSGGDLCTDVWQGYREL